MLHYFCVAKMSTFGNIQNSDKNVIYFITYLHNKIIYLITCYYDKIDISHNWQQNIVKNSDINNC